MKINKEQAAFMRKHGFVPASHAARVCHCSPTKIYQLMERAIVRGKVVGGTRYVEASSLLAYYTPDERELLEITQEKLLGPLDKQPPSVVSQT